MSSPKSELSLEFSNLCRSSGLIAVFAFGSRGNEIQQRLSGIDPEIENPVSDLDLGILADRDVDFDVMRIVDFSCAVDDLFGVPRADIVDLRKAPPYRTRRNPRASDLLRRRLRERPSMNCLCSVAPGICAYHERERRRMLLTPRSERRISSCHDGAIRENEVMTPSEISQKVVTGKIELVQRFVSQIEDIDLEPVEAFIGSPLNVAAGESESQAFVGSTP